MKAKVLYPVLVGLLMASILGWGKGVRDFWTLEDRVSIIDRKLTRLICHIKPNDLACPQKGVK